MRSGIGAIRPLKVLVLATALLAAACATPAPRPSPAIDRPWQTVSAAPAELTEVAVTAHDGRIWVAGGLRSDGTASDAVFIFDPATDQWANGPRLPEAVHHAQLVSTGAALVLVGGYVGNDPTSTVLRLDNGADGWSPGPPLPEPRGAGAAAFDGTRIVFAGGVGPGGVGSAGVSSDVFALSDGAWSRIVRLRGPREHLAATTDGAGRTFILGGRVGGLDRNLATADMIEGDKITGIGDLPTARGGVAAFWSPDLGACLAGGESPGGTNPEVECIRPSGTITILPDLATPRHGLGAAVVDGTAYVVLGGRQPGLFTSDVTETLELP